jgi:hypothetical protein
MLPEPPGDSSHCWTCHKAGLDGEGAFCFLCHNFICADCLPETSFAGDPHQSCHRCDEAADQHAREKMWGIV